MAHDIEKKLAADIALFKATGKLPKERDIIHVSENSNYGYWKWVSDNKEIEPLTGNPDILPDDTVSKVYSRANNMLEDFTTWYDDNKHQFTTREQEVYELSYQQGLERHVVAEYLGVIPRRISALKTAIAKKIKRLYTPGDFIRSKCKQGGHDE